MEDTLAASSTVLVYTSDDNLDGKHNLYAVSADGRHLNLSHELGEDHHVGEFALSPDERQVAFLADGMLHTVPADNDSPVPISLQLEQVLEFVWAPDGTRIAYSAKTSSAQVFIVDPNGANHANLSGTVGEVLTRIRWSPDGSWLSYISDKAGVGALYLVRPDGSEEVKISNSAAPTGTFRFPHYAWAPRANEIAFGDDASIESLSELWVSTDGAPAVQVSTETGTTGSIGPDSWWAWSADGIMLAYKRQDAQTGEPALFVSSKGGGDARRVSGVLHSVSSFVWCGDARLVYRDDDTLYATDLYGNVVELAVEPVIRRVQCSPDGSLVGFLASDSLIGPFSLIVADLALDPVLVQQISQPGAKVTDFAWGREPISQSALGMASNARAREVTTLGQPGQVPPGRSAWSVFYDERTDGRGFIHQTLPGGQPIVLARYANKELPGDIFTLPHGRAYFNYRRFHDRVFFDSAQVFGDDFSLPPMQLGPNAELHPLSNTEVHLLENVRGLKSLRDTI